MDLEEIKSKLNEIVKRHSKLCSNPITNDTNLIDDLGLDSVTMIKLITEIEDEIGIEFDFMSIEIDDIVIYQNLEQIVLTICSEL